MSYLEKDARYVICQGCTILYMTMYFPVRDFFNKYVYEKLIGAKGPNEMAHLED
jgi:hypothetical protein